MAKRLLPSTMALRVCYMSGEELTELTMEEEDTVAKVKAVKGCQWDRWPAIRDISWNAVSQLDTFDCFVKMRRNW